jgi:hypothetical protein
MYPPARSCNKVTAAKRKAFAPMPDGTSTFTMPVRVMPVKVMSWPTANTAGLFDATAVPLLHYSEVPYGSASDSCSIRLILNLP